MSDALNPQQVDPRSLPGNKKRLALGISIAGTIYTAIFAYVGFNIYSQTGSWQSGNLAYLAAFVSAICLFTIFPIVRNPENRVFIAASAIALVFIATPPLVTGTFIFVSTFLVAYTQLLASVSITKSHSSSITMVGLALAIFASMSDVFTPFQQIASQPILILLGVTVVIWVSLFAFLILRNILSINLRSKLLIGGLLAALVPVFIIAIIQAILITQSVTDATNTSLKFAAQQTAIKFDEFLQTNRDEIAQDSTLPAFINYLNTPPNERPGSAVEASLRLTIETLQKRPQSYLSSFGVLDAKGMNVYDTNPVEVGRFESFRTYFQVPVSSGRAYITNIEFSTSNGDPFIYFASPILNQDHTVIGVLRARFDALVFQRMAEANSGLLGLRSYPILVDENLIRVADTITPNNLYRSLVPLSAEVLSNLADQKRLPDLSTDQLATQMDDLAAAVKNGKNDPFFTWNLQQIPNSRQVTPEMGSIAYMTNKPWSVFYVQEQSILVALQREQIRLTAFLATIIAGAIALLALLAARLLTQPIARLTTTASKITAGDLDVTATGVGTDEIGTLAGAFNVMTSRLRNLIRELEDRVRARTLELETQNTVLVYRNQQIQTISEVARSVAAAQDVEGLLDRVSTLISERFGFYHVGVFLVDEQKENAVLRAANSEGGKRMLAHQHHLKVGQVGIVGYVTSVGKPRIALDVGEDAIHFRNPDLPLTRSEMALPLLSGSEVIGALDVQSENTNAFSQQDVELFSTLADQIAIAIANSRLLQETSHALEESQVLHRQYLRQEWVKFTDEGSYAGYLFSAQGIQPQPVEMLPGLNSQLDAGQISIETIQENGQPVNSLRVPVSLRSETIGVIHLRDSNPQKKTWTQEEIETARSIADQVSQALENARLFEQTLQRAERERRVLDITSKIRSTTDPETMMKIAREELQRALNASKVEFVMSGPAAEQAVQAGTNGNGFHVESNNSPQEGSL